MSEVVCEPYRLREHAYRKAKYTCQSLVPYGIELVHSVRNDTFNESFRVKHRTARCSFDGTCHVPYRTLKKTK